MDLTASQIAERLSDHTEELCQMLLSSGRQDGQYWICGDIAGNPGKSLKVHLTGGYKGQWKDWSNEDDRGDMLDLWRLSKGVSAGTAMQEARTYLGISQPVRTQETRTYKPAPQIATEPPKPAGRAFRYLTEGRKLTPATIEAYRIELDPERKAIVFPCYSPDGTLINRSYRTLDKKVWQDTDCAPSLFGWQSIKEETYRSKTILLAEGQFDAASWHQWGIPALSVPNGSGCAWIEYEWDNLSAFDTIYLAFDNDDTGKKITETAITRLGKHRCLIVALPKKDANQCLQDGFGPDDAKDWIANAKRPRIKRLVTTAEMEDRLVAETRPKPEPFTLPFMGGKWKTGEGFWFRPGEVTIWGGPTHAGKSTMLNFMVSQLMITQTRVFIASFELRVENLLRRFAAIFYGDNLQEDKMREFARSIGENIVFADIVGSIAQNELLEMLWFAHRRYGATHFVIDSLMRVDGLEEEYKEQGAFCNRLQAFAKETGGHVHLVAHLAKPQGQGNAKPTLGSIKGSSLLTNNVDNILLVLRNSEKDKKRKSGYLSDSDAKNMHDAEVIIEKQRDTGWISSYRLLFNPHRYMYSLADDSTVSQ